MIVRSAGFRTGPACIEDAKRAKDGVACSSVRLICQASLEIATGRLSNFVLALSSSYGSDGALIGREVARRLGLEFFDRAIPIAVAHRLAVDPQEAMNNDWRAPGRMQRVLTALAVASTPFLNADTGTDTFSNPQMYKDGTEAVLRRIADGAGGVILGRAATIVPGDRRDVLCVRLDGPVERRIQQAMQRRGIDESASRRDQFETDKARAAYVHVFYGRSLEDLRLYDVVLDSTAVTQQACVEVIVRLFHDRFDINE